MTQEQREREREHQTSDLVSEWSEREEERGREKMQLRPFRKVHSRLRKTRPNSFKRHEVYRVKKNIQFKHKQTLEMIRCDRTVHRQDV